MARPTGLAGRQVPIAGFAGRRQAGFQARQAGQQDLNYHPPNYRAQICNIHRFLSIAVANWHKGGDIGSVLALLPNGKTGKTNGKNRQGQGRKCDQRTSVR